VHTKTAYKEQLAIRLRHMEEKFGGLIMRKKGRVRTQHGVPTDHLADMDGSNICRRQPRSWYTGAKDKLIAAYRQHMEQLTVLGDQIKALAIQISNMCGHNENGSRNLFTEHETYGRQHHAQAHTHRRVSRFKLDI
jgi:transposase